MSKIIPASCQNGIVTAEDVIVTATLQSEGVGASEGLLILDEDRADYFAKTSPDLKSTLENLSTVLEKIASALEALDTAGFLIAATSGVPSPPLIVSEISDIEAIKTEIDNLKVSLK